MGFTHVTMKVKKSSESKKLMEERLLVDSGAIYTVIPEEDLNELGIRAHSEEEFEMADGNVINRKVGDAFFEYKEKKGSAPVVFGEKGDSKLLGVLTLEALGFILDPLKKEIKPFRKRLA
ncbi:aspartyl protease [candidate division KSB1 bacterium]|nr:aspartyl protease [candidate division KSB1 bacterium]